MKKPRVRSCSCGASQRAFMLMLDLKLRVANKTWKKKTKKSGDKREEAEALLRSHPPALRESPAEPARRVNESTAIKEKNSLWRCWRRAMEEATKTER